jgi:hypothetical protein
MLYVDTWVCKQMGSQTIGHSRCMLALSIEAFLRPCKHTWMSGDVCSPRYVSIIIANDDGQSRTYSIGSNHDVDCDARVPNILGIWWDIMIGWETRARECAGVYALIIWSGRAGGRKARLGSVRS